MITYAEVQRFNDTKFGRVHVIAQAETLPVSVPQILFIDLAGYSPTPLIGWYYDKTNDVFSETLPSGAIESKPLLTPVQFWFEKFTDDERAMVWAALAGVDLPGVSFSQERHRWRITAWRDVYLRSNVDRANSETIWCVNALELAGVISAGRAAEILG